MGRLLEIEVVEEKFLIIILNNLGSVYLVVVLIQLRGEKTRREGNEAKLLGEEMNAKRR